MSGTSGDGVDASLINSDGDSSYKVEINNYFEYENNLIKVFFDKESYEIKGWTTTDIYLNKVETKLSYIETNIMIDDSLFRIQNYIN